MNTLTAPDLRYLLGLCDAEVNRCGLDQASGRRARAMADKLAACIVTYPRKSNPRTKDETHDDRNQTREA